VVITHAFGRPFEIDALVQFAKSNGIPVFEDAVQSQMFPVYRGHPLSDCVVYSGMARSF
jgi:dTDP-4-amino-4,6-dideoxygalactose transaminase